MKQKELTVLQAALKRRSTRHFKPDPIPDDIFQKLLNATHAAPSSFNLQPTRIILIKDKKQKEALSAAAWNQKQIIEAPVTFVFAVAIRDWEKNLEKMISIAIQSGAWNEERADYVRKSAPPFQKNLGAKEREYAIKDALIMATHTALAAESLGLASCYMNGWLEDKVKPVIGAENNPNIAVALLMPIGYSASTPPNPGRFPQNEIFFTDKLL